MTEPVVVGLLGITHPHASARVRALREIDGVQVVAAADEDPRLKYFTDRYDLAPVTTDEILADDRITAVMVHSKSVDTVPLALRVLDAGKAVHVEKPGGAALADLGMAEGDIPRIAELAVADPYANPRPVTRDGIQTLLSTAWTGAPPPRTAPAVRTRHTEPRSRT